MSTAILLIAHGSRRAAANADLVHVARRLQERVPEQNVEVAYLELTEPTIPQGLQQCLTRGATRVQMLPYFLSAGAHVMDDLTEFRREFLQQNPGIECEISPPLGLHPKLIDVLVDRLGERLT